MKILYHVTLKRHARSIGTLGINPVFSKGARAASWWVAENRLNWSINHVATRHKVSPDELTIYAASFHHKQVKKFRLSGIFYCTTVVRPTVEIVLMAQMFEQSARKVAV